MSAIIAMVISAPTQAATNIRRARGQCPSHQMRLLSRCPAAKHLRGAVDIGGFFDRRSICRDKLRDISEKRSLLLVEVQTVLSSGWLDVWCYKPLARREICEACVLPCSQYVDIMSSQTKIHYSATLRQFLRHRLQVVDGVAHHVVFACRRDAPA